MANWLRRHLAKRSPSDIKHEYQYFGQPNSPMPDPAIPAWVKISQKIDRPLGATEEAARYYDTSGIFHSWSLTINEHLHEVKSVMIECDVKNNRFQCIVHDGNQQGDKNLRSTTRVFHYSDGSVDEKKMRCGLKGTPSLIQSDIRDWERQPSIASIAPPACMSG